MAAILRVRATQDGYYDRYRTAGEEFVIADKQAFHDSWMEWVTGAPAEESVTVTRTAAVGTKKGKTQQTSVI
jgi:hypothetical protein